MVKYVPHSVAQLVEQQQTDNLTVQVQVQVETKLVLPIVYSIFCIIIQGDLLKINKNMLN